MYFKMGDWVEYQGRNIAYFRIRRGRKSRIESEEVDRWDFRFESLEALENLLTADSENIVIVGDNKMTYARFRSEMLENAHRIYINPDCELFDEMYS